MSGLLGGLLGGNQQGAGGAVVKVLQQVLESNGGVQGLISRFEGAGLADKAQSWVSNGTNQPISADHIDQVFSQQEVESWASQAGTTPDKMRSVLAEALPHAVDHATPDGNVPPQGSTPDLGSLIGGLFGGKR